MMSVYTAQSSKLPPTAGLPQDLAARSSTLSSCLTALILNIDPPVNQVLHQLLSPSLVFFSFPRFFFRSLNLDVDPSFELE